MTALAPLLWLGGAASAGYLLATGVTALERRIPPRHRRRRTDRP